MVWTPKVWSQGCLTCFHGREIRKIDLSKAGGDFLLTLCVIVFMVEYYQLVISKVSIRKNCSIAALKKQAPGINVSSIVRVVWLHSKFLLRIQPARFVDLWLLSAFSFKFRESSTLWFRTLVSFWIDWILCLKLKDLLVYLCSVRRWNYVCFARTEWKFLLGLYFAALYRFHVLRLLVFEY